MLPVSPSGKYYCFDVGFSSIRKEGQKEGQVDAWGFASSTNGIPGPWSQEAHWSRGSLAPQTPQKLTLNSLITFNVYDKDYDPSDNATKLVNVTISFASKDGKEGPQSPVGLFGDNFSPQPQDSLNPIHFGDSAWPPFSTDWTSPGTKDSNAAVWEFMQQIVSVNSKVINCSYLVYNQGRFRCSVTVTILMPNGATKIFYVDPEMDVEAGG